MTDRSVTGVQEPQGGLKEDGETNGLLLDGVQQCVFGQTTTDAFIHPGTNSVDLLAGPGCDEVLLYLEVTTSDVVITMITGYRIGLHFSGGFNAGIG